MFTQEDIDAALNSAQDAVETLVAEVSPPTQGNYAPTTPSPPPVGHPATLPSPVRISANRLHRILNLKVPVVVRLAERRMPLQEVLRIVPGMIMEFNRSVDQELDLMANNHQIGGGVAVKVEEHFGLRVTFIGDVRERLLSLTR